MIGFIKRNLLLLSCGLVAFVALVALILGVVLGDVGESMEQASSLASSLSRMRSGVVSAKDIDLSKAKYEAIARDYTQIMTFVKETNARKPLRDDVFPEPRTTSARYQFQSDYKAALRGLLETLKADGPPTGDFVSEIKDLIAREKQRLARERGFGASEEAPEPNAPGVGAPGFPAGPSFQTAPPGQAPAASEMTPEMLARDDPNVRAALVRAHSILCYGTREALDVRQDVLDTQQPSAIQMWDAQVSLWLQQDIVKALANLNNAKVEEIKARNRKEAPWVGDMPVKELERIRIGDYVLSGVGGGARGGARPGGMTVSATWVEPGGSGIAASPEQNFTHLQSNALFDVVPFAVELVIDARSLPSVIDALASVNFFVPLSVTFRTIPPSENLTGKIYGPSPLYDVRLEFDACMFREYFHTDQLMPPALQKQIQSGARIEPGTVAPRRF